MSGVYPVAMSRGSGYHEPWELQVGEEWWEDLSEMDNLTEESLLQEMRRQYEGEPRGVFSPQASIPLHCPTNKSLRQLRQLFNNTAHLGYDTLSLSDPCALLTELYLP